MDRFKPRKNSDAELAAMELETIQTMIKTAELCCNQLSKIIIDPDQKGRRARLSLARYAVKFALRSEFRSVLSTEQLKYLQDCQRELVGKK